MYQPILQNQQNQELIIGAPEIPISIEYMAQQPQCQPLIQFKDRRKFLILMMLTCFCQTGLELAIALISAYSINIQDLKLSFAIPMFIFLIIAQLLLLQIIKSKPQIRDVINNKQLDINQRNFVNSSINGKVSLNYYTTIVTSSICIFGVRLFYNTILIFGIIQLQICLISSYFILGVYFTFYEDPNIKQTLISSMLFPLVISIIVISLSFNFQNCLNDFCIQKEFSVMIFFIFIFFLYLGFATSQVISLFQILNGKFRLQHDQFIVANLLLFYNTLLPFLE